MSLRYKGAILSATPPTTTGGNSGTAPGNWTLQQQMQAQSAGTWPSFVPNYIEDVFSTYLYKGNSSTQTITNGIDVSTKGGLTWAKARDNTIPHYLFDTARGGNRPLSTNSTSSQGGVNSTDFTGFTSSGFTLGFIGNDINNTNYNYASWTFRKQPKFFDVVTYTGTGANRTIAHNLGSVPGCIIVKRTDTTGDWCVYHRGLAAPSTQYGVLNSYLGTPTNSSTIWNSTNPTDTVFSVGTDAAVNASGGTYVAYIFAHNAGGFGLTGTDNVISCGTFTTNNTGGIGNATVDLGYEPQWLLVKDLGNNQYWTIADNLRGINAAPANTGSAKSLWASASSAESNAPYAITSTGFTVAQYPSTTYIYIAIRRGPMKTPTDATKVFSPIAVNAAQGTAQTTGFVIDSQWKAKRATDTLNTSVDDRLRGNSTTTTASGRYLITSGTAAEATTNATTQAWSNTGFQIPTYYASASDIFYSFARAPGFFDVVCYTGDGTSNRAINHNLASIPELVIVKARSSPTYASWMVGFNFEASTYGFAYLNQTGAGFVLSYPLLMGAPSATVFRVSQHANNSLNDSTTTYVAYLFASCPGVSKVGSYTGTGATQTIDCGFTGGARFVLIKRTDSTGDWYVWDTARGMVSGTDPSLLLNSTAAEVNANSIYTTTGGFQIVSTAAGINASGGTYIYLAIA